MAQNAKKGASGAGANRSAAGTATKRKGSAAASSAKKRTASKSSPAGSASGGRAAGGKRSASGRGAGTRASSANRRQTAGRRTAALERARRERERREREIRICIALVAVFIVMLFLFLSLTGIGGGVGRALSGILFGLFGIGAWMVPPFLFVLCLLLLTGAGGTRAPMRMAAWALLVLVAQTAAHLRLHTAHALSLDAPFEIPQTFSQCADRAFGGGGILGGAAAWALYHAFRIIGSGILLAGITVIAVLLLVQRSPAGLVRRLTARERDGEELSFRERRQIMRQRRLEEYAQERDRELEREADRILAREDAAAHREEGRQARRRARHRDGGEAFDLEHIRLGYEDAGLSGEELQGRRRRGRRADALRDGRRDAFSGTRDVHEITVLDDEEDDLLTIPSKRRAGRADPEGTRFGRLEELDGPAGSAQADMDADMDTNMQPGHGYGADGMPAPVSGVWPRSGDGAAAGPEGPLSGVPVAGPEGTKGRLREEPGAGTGTALGGGPRADLSGHADGTREHAPRESGQALRGRLTTFSESSYGASGTEDAGQERGPAAQGTRTGAFAGPDPAGNEAAYGDAHAGQGRAPHGLPAAGTPSGTISGAALGAAPGVGVKPPSEEELEGIAVHREAGSGKGRTAPGTAIAKRSSAYTAPPFSILERGSGGTNPETERELKETAFRLQETLRTFGVQVTITDISQGPSVTRYELMPDSGVKVSRIVNLSDDIKLRLAATDIRIEAPIPGKSAIGIEVPNRHETTVHLRELLESRDFRRSDGKLPFAVGKDIAGKTVIADIARMPHLLIAGATGSGKSVCINTIILSILYRTSPENVKLLMIDPKVVELSVYKRIPHLIIPVVTDARKASAALNWAVAEMEKRYKLFAAAGVRDLNGYNHLASTWRGDDGELQREPMPRLVIIVDELADLMMVSKNEVESAICRLAQLARAAGIHLIIATQRPSVDVITGLIKANMPSRIAFAVSSQVDSRTILDMAGAEKLIGKGDMLFYPQNYQKPRRIQGAFVSDDEVTAVVDYLHAHNDADGHDREIAKEIESIEENGLPAPGSAADARAVSGRDEHFAEAGRFVIEKNKASIGLLQRVYKIGFNRAARIMDQLADAGVVSEESSTRARTVLMTLPEFEAYLENES